jgi:hypothetical protein
VTDAAFFISSGFAGIREVKEGSPLLSFFQTLCYHSNSHLESVGVLMCKEHDIVFLQVEINFVSTPLFTFLHNFYH